MAALGAIATASAALALGTGWTAPSVPKLSLVDAHPVVLRGTAFRPHERVRINVLQPTIASRTTRAGAAGRFVARFAFSVGRCEDFEVWARGSRGSRAMLELPGPDCIEP